MSMRMRHTTPSLLERLAGIPKWGWFFIGFGVLVLAAIPAVGLARTTTSSSEYCLTCHATGETPDKGRLSLVHPDFQKVSCVDCHAKPNQVVYEGYVNGFMAEPERVAPNCVRCHEGMTKTNEQKGFKYNFLNINITHQNHLERGATCVTCHSNIAHDLSVVPTNRPTMDTCSSCHAKSDSCVKCHGQQIPQKALPPPAPPSADMLGDGRIYYLRICTACHGVNGNQVASVNLRSKEYLDKQGMDNLVRAISDGKGNMHPFSVKKGGQLTDDQIKATIAYLQEEAVAKSLPNAEVLYNRYCVTCHGSDGKKVAGVPLTLATYWEQQSVSRAFSSVQSGKSGMPPFGKAEGGNLSRQEITAVLQLLQDKAGPIPQKTPAGGVGEGLPTPSLLDGKPLYDKYCAMCHGVTGNQMPTADLSSAQYLKQKGTAALVKAVTEGSGGMPPMGKAKGGQLEVTDVQAIIAYLEKASGTAALPQADTGKQAATPAVAATTLADGKPLYDKYCAMCHGAAGNQLPMVDLGSGQYVQQKGITALARVITEGSGGMPPMGKAKGGQLEATDVQAIVAYLQKGVRP